MPNSAGHGHLRSVLLHNALLVGNAEPGYATQEVMFDTRGVIRANFTLVCTYAATSAGATGLTVTQKYGIYDPYNTPSGIIYAGNTDPISTIVNPPTSSGLVTTVSTWNSSLDIEERLLFYDIANLDPVNTATLTFIADYN